MMYGLLAGLTIIEGAAFVAAPSCGLHLAQLGARVIRFDPIGGGPDIGRWPLAADGSSLYWEGLNKGKLSIAIDLECPEGRELAREIATAGDGLFVTNFPADGFLSYARLAELRADLVCLRIMGWADGAPAVDYTINAALGLPLLTGHADDPRPVNHVLPAWDLLTGAQGALSLLAAERERARSGKGGEIRLSLADVAATTLGNLGQIAEVLGNGEDRPRVGNALFGAFGRDFLTAGGERLMIVALTARQWAGLVSALELDEEVGALQRRVRADFGNEGERFVHRGELFPLFEKAIARRSLGDLAGSFERNGVCWSRYDTLSGAIRNEPRLVTDSPIFAEVAHPSGSYPTPGCAARLSGRPRAPAVAAPRIGEHTDIVLAELLGFDSGAIGRLHDRGLVA